MARKRLSPSKARRVSPKTAQAHVEGNALPREYLDSLLGGLKMGVGVVSKSGEFLYTNPRLSQLFGIVAFPYRRSEGSRTLQNCISPSCWTDLQAALTRAVVEPAEATMDMEAPEGGPLRYLRVVLFPLRAPGNDIGIIAEEVTELRKANQAVTEAHQAARASEASFQSLSARILQMQDDVQRRVARNLHDISGQDLAVLAMSIAQLAKNRKSAEAGALVKDSLDLVHKIESDIRTVSYLLHPPLLDEMGLIAALGPYIGGLAKRSDFEVQLAAPKDLPRLPMEVETGLFRVVQEGLTNVLRHSGTRKAEVNISNESGVLRVAVIDNGSGFAHRTRSAGEHGTVGGVGIQGMRERLRQLGGSLQIHSQPGRTEVIAAVPIHSRAREASGAALGDSESESKSSSTKIPPAAPTRTAQRRILIVDDHEVTRQGIRTLVEAQPDLEVCGEAKDGLEAVNKTAELQPDLIIMDLSMPKVGGLSAAYRIFQLGLDVKIVIFSTHEFGALERIIRAAGCHGYVAKANASRDLIQGLRAVLNGDEFYVSPAAQVQGA